MSDKSQPPPLRRTALGTATAPFAQRPPSPPYIHVPVPSGPLDGGQTSMTLVPSFQHADPTALTEADLQIITRNVQQRSWCDTATEWKYESRRQAQPILDYLYLGPSSAAKDRAFLEAEGITLLLAARDTRMAQVRLMSVERVAESLGIEAQYIDTDGHQQLIGLFPKAVQVINDHLLRVYRSQAITTPGAAPGLAAPSPDDQGQGAGGGRMVINDAAFRRGKVLVFCETGNDRSAAIVAAYIMNVYGVDLVTTLQFIQQQRFCVTLDEDAKHLLHSYEGILLATRQVQKSQREYQQHLAQHRQQQQNRRELEPPLPPSAALADQKNGNNPPSSFALNKGAKRRISRTMEDEDIDMDDASHDVPLDEDRFADRAKFTPFLDKDDPMNSIS